MDTLRCGIHYSPVPGACNWIEKVRLDDMLEGDDRLRTVVALLTLGFRLLVIVGIWFRLLLPI